MCRADFSHIGPLHELLFHDFCDRCFLMKIEKLSQKRFSLWHFLATTAVVLENIFCKSFCKSWDQAKRSSIFTKPFCATCKVFPSLFRCKLENSMQNSYFFDIRPTKSDRCPLVFPAARHFKILFHALQRLSILDLSVDYCSADVYNIFGRFWVNHGMKIFSSYFFDGCGRGAVRSL